MSRRTKPAEALPQPDLARDAKMRALGYLPMKGGAWGCWQEGRYFGPGQGESFHLLGPNTHIDAQIHVVELEDGSWLAGGEVYGARYPTQKEALVVAARLVMARIVQGVIGHEANGRWYPPLYLFPRHKAEAVIEWAAGIAGIAPVPIPERHLMQPPPPPPPAPPPQGVLL